MKSGHGENSGEGTSKTKGIVVTGKVCD